MTKPGTMRMLGRGFLKHCPRCGRGKLFPHWFTMLPACPSCGHQFERHASDAFFLGAFAINFGVTELVLAIIIFFGFLLTWPDTPTGLLIAIACVETIVVPLVFYPFSKTIWAAIDLAMLDRLR